jgi:hypothetical protein
LALEDNARDFDKLLGQAQGLIAKRKPVLAAIYAQAAADLAWGNHPGFFASPPFEATVCALAEAVRSPEGADRWSWGPERGRRILHVLTQAYPSGGHTRLVSNWIRLDVKSVHAVVVTGQRGLRLPEFLATAIPCRQLDSNGEDPLSRASTLRSLAASCDLVVLHHHPSDVVPGLAFPHSAFPNVPVVTMNHADHVYWTGTSVSHVVANLRASGQQLAIERRGIEASRCAIIPIPLREASRGLSPARAKERLGLAPDTFILLTVAQAYKYRSIAGVSLLDLVLPWLRAHPRAVLIAVGPEGRDAWARAAVSTGGRVRAMGTLTDLTPYYECADVYLDSYPLASLTSALQAGMLALPLLTYASRPPEAGVLGADSPGLDPVMLQATAPHMYADALTSLYDDPGLRRRMGDETAASIIRWHTGQGWREACDSLCDLAATLGASAPSPVPVLPGHTALDELLCEIGGGRGIADSLTRQLPFMTLGARLSTWFVLRQRGARPRARQLLPEALLQIVRRRRSPRRGLPGAGEER